LQNALIIGFAALSIYLGWRLYSIRRGIVNLTAALKEDPPPNVKDLVAAAKQPRLKELSRASLNTLSEASLGYESERSQREFLEALLNEINDSIFILDSNNEIRFLNEAAKALFPSDQPYLFRPFLDLSRDHRIFDTLQLARDLGAKTSEAIVLRIASDAPGRIREVNLQVEAEPLPLPSKSGEVEMGVWILLRDVTSEMETDQIRRDFIANASHELRTPLSIINGYLETMDESNVDLNQALFRRAIRTMRKHGERIARIVEDMLMISKLENAADLLNREPFDLHDSLDEMISQLAPLIEASHARIKVDVGEQENWILIGDRYYWDQIFFNLIENALKQNREPGLRIKISFRREKGRYLIIIDDDGIGIPAADLPLIFKRFYRVQKHHAQNDIKGTGLGLSIVKRAVEAHNGTISVDSHPGKSTRFTISVPETAISTGSQSLETKSRNE